MKPPCENVLQVCFDRLLGDLVCRLTHAMVDQKTGQRIPPEQTLEPLLTVQEAADYLRLTPRALYNQRYRGDDPGALGIRVGKKILYRTSDIDRFLDERLAETHPTRRP